MESPEHELKRLDKALKLSHDQKGQILPILKERAAAMKTLFSEDNISMRDKYPKIVEVEDRSNSQIRNVLTEAQRVKFDRMVADEKKRREDGPDDGPPGDMPPPGDAPPPPQE